MKKNEIMIVINYSEKPSLNLDELCNVCRVTPEFIDDLINYDIIKPKGSHPREWIFNLDHLQRTKTALRLYQDLEMNMAGIAVVLDLLDENENLREKLGVLQQYFSKI